VRAPERAEHRAGDRELLRARPDVAEHLAFARFGQRGDLQVKAAEVAVLCTQRRSSVEHRTGDHAMLALVQFARDEGVDRRAEPGAQQPRRAHRRAGKRDHPPDVQFTSAHQMPEGDHVLVANVPDVPLHADRVHAVDVPADGT